MSFWKITSLLILSILALYHMGLLDTDDGSSDENGDPEEEEPIYLLEDARDLF